MGKDHSEKLASQSTKGSLSEAKLPPPTNVNAQTSGVSVNSLDEHLKLGEAELKSGRYAQAKSHFQSVLLEQPQHVEANHRMGVLSDKIGDFETAEQHYRLALINDPRNAALLSDFGYSYWLQGRYLDSERLLLQARQVDPQYKNAVANLGMVYGTTGRQEEALALFRQIGNEAAAQDMLKQVASMAPQSGAPVVTGGSMSPVTLASNEVTPPTSMSPRDSQNVNEPTQKILDLMEEARREQAVMEQDRANSDLATRQRQTPPFVQNRPETPQGYVPQMAGVDPFHSQRGLTSDQQQIPDAMLSHALARIDQEGRRTPQDGPITLGPSTNPSYNNAPQPNGAPYGAAQPTSPQYDSPNANRQQPGIAGPNPFATTGSSQQSVPIYTGTGQQLQTQPPVNANPTQQPGYNVAGSMQQFDANGVSATPSPMTQPPAGFEPVQAAAQPGSSAIITYGNPNRNPAAAGSPTQRMAPNGNQSFSVVTASGVPASSAGIPPSKGVQQASGFMIQQNDPNRMGSQESGQSPVEHAYHQQQPGAQPPIDLLGAAGQPTAIPPTSTVPPATPGSQWPLIPAGSADPNDPYQQARREAAIMGLGVGPGQMFPYVQQTNRAVPGTSSMMNGAQYPAPQRQLPIGMNPADLSPSFAGPQATNLTPGQSYQGQLLPQVAAPITNPSQYGAPASATFQQYEQMGYTGPPPTSYTQVYEDVRQQSAQQLNGLINQTYGQPVQTPPSGIAALPSQTYHAPQNPALSQYSAPQLATNPPQATYTQPVADAAPDSRWTPPQLTAPTTQSTRPTEYNAPQTYTSTPTTNPNENIVVPEQYPAAVKPGYQTNSNLRQSPVYSSSSQPSGNLPIIVPGKR
ncbi:MAG: tetratricopeptide repeat protein [Planctomycetaceae bacterium]